MHESQDLLLFLAQSMKYCCKHSFLRACETWRTGKLALKLGVHRRTIAYWREDLKEGKFPPCPHCQLPENHKSLE